MVLVIQGHVDNQRIERRNAYLIHASMCEKPVEMMDYLPLPYDWELKEAPQVDDISDEQLMMLVNESGYLTMNIFN